MPINIIHAVLNHQRSFLYGLLMYKTGTALIKKLELFIIQCLLAIKFSEDELGGCRYGIQKLKCYGLINSTHISVKEHI